MLQVKQAMKACILSCLSVPGISNVTISVPDDLVLLDSSLTTSEVHSLLESTGLLVFFKGFGSISKGNYGALSQITAAFLSCR